MHLGHSYRAIDYARAIYEFDELTSYMEMFFTKYDMILTPTLAQPPLKIGALQFNTFEKIALSLINKMSNASLLKKLAKKTSKTINFMPFTTIFNITGQPAMSIPLYWNQQGLPIGSQFASRIGNELELLQLAQSLESKQPWMQKVPNIY